MPGRRYSTGSNLNANSALIQNLYSQEAAPLRAVHLAIDTGLEESGKGAGVKAYIRSARFFFIISFVSSYFATAHQLESLLNLRTACSHLFQSNSGFVKPRRAGVSLISHVKSFA